MGDLVPFGYHLYNLKNVKNILNKMCLTILWDWCLKGQCLSFPTKKVPIIFQVWYRRCLGQLKTLLFWQIVVHQKIILHFNRSSPPEVSLRDVFLEICSKKTENPCWGVTSIKLLWNFIEITLWHGCSLVNLLDIFRTTF